LLGPIAVRAEEKAEAVQGPPLKLASLRAVRGLALPQFCPPGPPMGNVPIPMAVALLGPCADTTSSSSAANADDPRTRLGLGERQLGDPEPELASPFPPPAVGRAIGAIGRVIGPGPEASLLDADAWRPWPGARPAGAVPCAAGFAAFVGPIGGGRAPKGTPTPIGIPRLKVGSKDPPLKPRAGTGLNGGGCCCCILGPPYPYAIGGKFPTRGDIADGDIIPTGPWGCPYIIPAE
jgi:hypothetical protein